jgi:spermidine synthase
MVNLKKKEIVNNRSNSSFFSNRLGSIGLTVFLTSMTLLGFEVLLTRIFSVMIWYHFAFMVISSGLFGFGLSALVYYIIKQRRQGGIDDNQIITFSSLLLPLTIILSFMAVINTPLNYGRTIFLLSYFVASAIPFFFGGLTIVTAISHFGKSINRVYFADLIGAGLGTLLSLILISYLSGENAILALAIIASFAGISHTFIQDSMKVKALAGIILVISISAVVINSDSGALTIQSGFGKFLFSDALAETNKPIIYTGWNVFSRIDVISDRPVVNGEIQDDPVGTSIVSTPFWGISRVYEGEIPDNQGLFIDADAYTPIIKWSGGLDDPVLDPLLYDITGFAHHVFKDDYRSLVLGSGGGKDVLTALSAGSSNVVAVEINPLIVDYVRDNSDYNGGLYDRSDVEVVVGDARNYVINTREEFDFIQLSYVASWTAIAAGGYSLSEGFIYTEEAFQDYYNRLAPGGILSVTYWSYGAPKMALTSYFALQDLGLESVDAQYFMVTNNYSTPDATTVLLKKGPFTQEEVDNLRQTSDDLEFNIVYDPMRDTFEEALSRPPFMNLPKQTVRDDSPYFFRDLSIVDLPFGISLQLPLAVLFVLLIEASVLTFVSLILPQFILSRKNSGGKLLKNWKFLTYFSCLGIGFIMFEIALLPKFTLYLGSPLYSLSLILFSLLLASGFGSYFSPHFKDKMVQVTMILIGIMVVYAFSLGEVFNLTAGLDIFQRGITTVALVMIPGFFMGMFLPTGIKLVSFRAPEITPWMWNLNSVTSVLGSIIAPTVALLAGLTVDIISAALIYLLAIGLLRSIIREDSKHI